MIVKIVTKYTDKTRWTVSRCSHMIPLLFGKQEVGIWQVKKRFPRYGVPIWSLWPNIRFLPSIVAEKNATTNGHIQNVCSMCIQINSRQTGSRNLMGPKTLPTIWYTYMTLVTKYQISAINSYWEKCNEKYLGRTDGQTDRDKTVYPPPPPGSGGIISVEIQVNKEDPNMIVKIVTKDRQN